jgi:hypothetical protein
MSFQVLLRRIAPLPVIAVVLLTGLSLESRAQFGFPPPGPPRPAREAAPIDLTGYWVSVVTEDWRFRIMLAPKGDTSGVPLNPAGRKVAEAWDPAKDEADGLQCKAYGAADIMRIPGRLNITWVDDNTMQIETDAGMQKRLIHFGNVPPPTGEPAWQGHSVGEWEAARGGGPRGSTGFPGAGGPGSGALKITTTHMRPGYLRRNGVPYSEKAVMTEYIDLVAEANGKQWIVVKTIIEDPEYLFVPYVTSPNFRKEPDGSGWKPTPCRVR